jgi:hypothetical protein
VRLGATKPPALSKKWLEISGNIMKINDLHLFKPGLSFKDWRARTSQKPLRAPRPRYQSHESRFEQPRHSFRRPISPLQNVKDQAPERRLFSILTHLDGIAT